MARASLEAANINTTMMDNREVASLALRGSGYHSSSDFPLILENIVNKSIRMGYELAPRTWEPLVRERGVPDFKQVSEVHLGEFSSLEKMPELGEYKHGSFSETAEKYAIETYGKKLAISRRMIINDDLDAFSRVPSKMGQKARDLESDKVWSLIKDNAQVMAETGNTLFNAAHNNLNEGGAGAVSEAALQAIREAMRLQKDLDGTAPLNLRPAWLFVPAAREVEARKILSAITPQESAKVNVFSESLSLAVEPRLDDVGTKPWLVSADKSQADMLVMARLSGSEQPQIESKEGWDVDGVEFKIRHEFVVHALDFRAMSKNDGV